MKQYLVNVKQVDITYHPGNDNRRIKYNEKDFSLLVVSLMMFGKTSYYAIPASALPDTDSIHIKIVMDDKLRWSPAYVNDVVVDVTGLYNK